MDLKVYKVGGAVRDEIMGIEPHDIDYCVVGSTVNEMLSLGYKQVGKDFPVFLDKDGNEYALARTERKTGKKHTDFNFEFGKNVSLEDDLSRRDITVNAIAQDMDTGAYIDPFGGINDIKNKIIRCVKPETFVQDPLRVMRVCRFCAQLGFNIEIHTLQVCRDMVKNGELNNLTPERIWLEFEKALKTDHFDYFIKAMRWTGALKVILPEVEQLFNTPENPQHHPELNSGEHTLLVLEKSNSYNSFIKFGCLLHDIGKIKTPNDELPKHIGHDKNGINIIMDICKRLKVPNEYRDFAIISCKYHMKLKRVPDMRVGSKFDLINELTKFKNIQKLKDMFLVSRLDLLGRAKKPSDKNVQYIETGLQQCMEMYNALSNIRANDFPELCRYKGKEYGEMLRVKKIQYFLNGDNYDKSKSND